VSCALRGLEFGEGFRIVDQFGRGLDAADTGARRSHLGQHVLFEMAA
jgi:hypothetical protein